MDAYQKPTPVGRAPRVTKADMKRWEAAAKAERERRAALTPEQRAAEDRKVQEHISRIDAAIAAEQARNTTRRHFDSVQEYCNAPFVVPGNQGKVNQRPDGTFYTPVGMVRRAGWYGPDNPSPEVTVRRVLNGWPEGAAEIRRKLERLDVAPPVTVKRKVHRADQGDELDIHAVNRGALDVAWTTRRRKNTHGPRIVRIVAQTNLLAATASEEMFWRGAAVVKLADVLTDAGYTVEIMGAMASIMVDGKTANWLVTFPLKHAQSPLDIEALAGVACNAGFHRTFGFRAYAACSTAQRSADGGTGDHSDRSGDIIGRSDLMEGAVHTFMVPYSMSGSYSAKEWISACCKQLDENQR